MRAVLQAERIFRKPGEVKHDARNDTVLHARQQLALVDASKLVKRMGARADFSAELVKKRLALRGGQRGPCRDGSACGLHRIVQLRALGFANLTRHVFIYQRTQLKILG